MNDVTYPDYWQLTENPYACSVLVELGIQYRKYIRETGVCVMSEPWGSLPADLASDVSGCWASIFPDGVPGWLANEAGLSEEPLLKANPGAAPGAGSLGG
jgi:hypothetical protein